VKEKVQMRVAGADGERPGDRRGYYGVFGGRFVPEPLIEALDELDREFEKARADVGLCWFTTSWTHAPDPCLIPSNR